MREGHCSSASHFSIVSRAHVCCALCSCALWALVWCMGPLNCDWFDFVKFIYDCTRINKLALTPGLRSVATSNPSRVCSFVCAMS